MPFSKYAFLWFHLVTFRTCCIDLYSRITLLLTPVWDATNQFDLTLSSSTNRCGFSKTFYHNHLWLVFSYLSFISTTQNALLSLIPFFFLNPQFFPQTLLKYCILIYWKRCYTIEFWLIDLLTEYVRDIRQLRPISSLVLVVWTIIDSNFWQISCFAAWAVSIYHPAALKTSVIRTRLVCILLEK